MTELLDVKKKYSFLPPFDVYNNDLEITLVGLPDLAALVAGLVNVYETIYKPVGLTRDNLENDIRNNVKIMTFKVTETDYLHIPQSYLADNVVDGVRMVNKVLIINLGPLLLDEDIAATNLAQDVSSLVTASLGVIPTYSFVDTTGVTHIPQDDVSAYLAKRVLAKTTEDSSFYIKWLREKERNTQLRQELNALESAIGQ